MTHLDLQNIQQPAIACLDNECSETPACFSHAHRSLTFTRTVNSEISLIFFKLVIVGWIDFLPVDSQQISRWKVKSDRSKKRFFFNFYCHLRFRSAIADLRSPVASRRICDRQSREKHIHNRLISTFDKRAAKIPSELIYENFRLGSIYRAA